MISASQVTAFTPSRDPYQFATTAGKKTNWTDDGRPSDPVSRADGTAACTHADSLLASTMRYQSQYASALVPVAASSPVTISRRAHRWPGSRGRSPTFWAPATSAGALQSG